MIRKYFLRGWVLCAALVLLTVGAQAATTVNVTTSEELLNTLVDEASDLVIQLNGRYEIPAETPIHVTGLRNVTIKGTPGTQIIAMNCDKPVLTLNSCKDVVLDTLDLRHYLTPEFPGTSAVLAINNCFNSGSDTTGMWVRNCNIYGGKCGISATGSTFQVQNSSIQDCSYYIAELNESSPTFEDCQFLSNGAFDRRGENAAFEGNSSEAEFYRCNFENNTSIRKTGTGFYRFDKTCTYRSNGWENPCTGTRSYQVGNDATLVMDWDAFEPRAVIRGSGPMWSSETMPVIAGYAMDHAFHIVVESGITDIGTNFSGLAMLNTVSLPGTLREIPERAFADTKWVNKIEIAEGPTRIGNEAFLNCNHSDASKRIAEFRIPSTVTSIGQKAFYNCRLESLKVPSTVQTIGTDALEYCVVLDTLYYGGSKEQWAALANGTGLTDDDYHDNLWKTKFVYGCAFYNSNSPRGVTLPNGVFVPDGTLVYAAQYDAKGRMLDTAAVGTVRDRFAEFRKAVAPNSVIFFANGAGQPLRSSLFLA